MGSENNMVAVPVTDADREAAISTVPDDGSHSSYMMYEAIKHGRGDDWPLVQAFARHRLASPQPDAQQGEAERRAVVAYLRRQSDLGANRALEADKGTTKRSAFGGGMLALKRAADNIEAGEHVLNDNAATSSSPALDAATIERCDCIDLEALTYDELWQAIADATRVEAGIVAISVVKFREAIRALPNAEKRHG